MPLGEVLDHLSRMNRFVVLDERPDAVYVCDWEASGQPPNIAPDFIAPDFPESFAPCGLPAITPLASTTLAADAGPCPRLSPEDFQRLAALNAGPVGDQHASGVLEL